MTPFLTKTFKVQNCLDFGLSFLAGGDQNKYTFFIGNSIFHLSLELLTKFWKTSLKVAEQLLSFIVGFYTIYEKSAVLTEKKTNLSLGSC